MYFVPVELMCEMYWPRILVIGFLAFLATFVALSVEIPELIVRPSRSVVHPQNRYIVRPIESTAQIALKHSPDFREEPDVMGRWLRPEQPSAQIGRLEGSPEQIFGKIKDVAVDGLGRIYVLDSRFNDLRVFDPEGRFLQRLGGPGHGPGEFVNPLSLTVDADGHVFVGDATFQLHKFAPDADTLVYKHSFRIQFAPRDLCTMHGRLYVHGVDLKAQKLVHVFDVQGQELASFGTLYRSGNALVDYQISRGHVACLSDERIIAYAPDGLIPEVRGYHISGNLEWVTRIRDYRPAQFTELAKGTRFQIPEHGYHTIHTIAPVGGSKLVLQVAYARRDTRERYKEFDKLFTYFLSGSNGEPLAKGDLKSTVTFLGSSHRLLANSTPYPHLIIQHWEGE